MSLIKLFYKHTLIFIFIFIALNYSIKYFFEHQKESYLNVQTEFLNTQYETEYRYLGIMSHDIYTMYQDNSQLISTFEQAQDASTAQRAILREDMYNSLKKRYKRLVNMGVKQLHFHLKDNTSFLRMHEAKEFDDNLTDIRPTIANTNSTLKSNSGFEVGKVAHGFRYVYPLFGKNKKHIGSVEISFSSQQLLENISDKFVINKQLLILKSEVYENMDKKYIDDIYHESLQNPNYLVNKIHYAKFKDKKFYNIIQNRNNNEDTQLKMKEGNTFSVSSSYNYHTLVVTFLPLESITKQKNQAFIVLYTESDYIDSLLIESNYLHTLLTSLLIMLFIFSIFVTLTQERLKQMAHYDKLTQLPNRAYFYIELEREIKRAKRVQQNIALMFIDLDGFKTINDSYGHHAGDQILIQAAKRLKKVVRNMDVVARIGGDEFIVLLTDIKTEKDSTLVAQKIIDSLNEKIKVNNLSLHIGASIGISCYPKDANESDGLISNADEAMYKAKENGKNKFFLFENKK